MATLRLEMAVTATVVTVVWVETAVVTMFLLAMVAKKAVVEMV